ncbi:hypothetical protein KP509_04G062800 [Ceratopteris richardii]|uniref:Uncharacterized protein n=1 Tax=Ceratopteris richardii TaxID=49495 RepID=A0A8T2V108_CERRI|nr:hypothetical protein KP509_04G062800 [Ceratopteris richardii]
MSSVSHESRIFSLSDYLQRCPTDFSLSGRQHSAFLTFSLANQTHCLFTPHFSLQPIKPRTPRAIVCLPRSSTTAADMCLPPPFSLPLRILLRLAFTIIWCKSYM